MRLRTESIHAMKKTTEMTQAALKREFLTTVRRLRELGNVSSTAYDTAWVARLGDLDPLISGWALDWLRQNQLADGSWGTQQPLYHHDRLICTLAAVIALKRQGAAGDMERIQRAVPAIQRSLDGLPLDLSGETIGFEVIVPTLIDEADRLGIISISGNPNLAKLRDMRKRKLSMLPKGLVNKAVPLAFSAEMAGTDGLHLLDLDQLQEDDGSVGENPSSTAYFVTQVNYGDERALAYLRKIASFGGTPHLAPLEVFEHSWVLWNLSVSGLLDNELLEACKPFLDHLQQSWDPKEGVGHTAAFTPTDGDDTALAYEALAKYGRYVPLTGLLGYESDSYFKCFKIESNASTSTNVHVLGALRQAGLPTEHPSVQKLFAFLSERRLPAGYWIDKWHISPYYVTGHMIITCANYADSFVEQAVNWVLETRHADGSWGYHLPTAEETAYCLQALSIWKQQGHDVPDTILRESAAWLSRNAEAPFPPLWIGKCLYSPRLVIKSAILSALSLAQLSTSAKLERAVPQSAPRVRKFENSGDKYGWAGEFAFWRESL